MLKPATTWFVTSPSWEDKEEDKELAAFLTVLATFSGVVEHFCCLEAWRESTYHRSADKFSRIRTVYRGSRDLRRVCNDITWNKLLHPKDKKFIYSWKTYAMFFAYFTDFLFVCLFLLTTLFLSPWQHASGKTMQIGKWRHLASWSDFSDSQ